MPSWDPPAVGTGSALATRRLPREPPAGGQCAWACARSDATRGLGCPSLAPSPLCLGSRASKCLNRELPLDFCSFLSSRWQEPLGWGGVLGPQPVGRRPVDRASWPALILCFLPTCPPEPCSPPCPPRSAFWGEEQALVSLTALSSPGRVSPFGSPMATQPGQTCGWEPRLPRLRSLEPVPPLLLLQRTPGTNTRPGSAPRGAAKPQRPLLPEAPGPALPPLFALLPARVPGSPSAVPQGPLIHWPRRLRTCPCLPLQEVPPFSAKPGRASGQHEDPAGD